MDDSIECVGVFSGVAGDIYSSSPNSNPETPNQFFPLSVHTVPGTHLIEDFCLPLGHYDDLRIAASMRTAHGSRGQNGPALPLLFRGLMRSTRAPVGHWQIHDG